MTEYNCPAKILLPLQPGREKKITIKAESFYYVNYGSSIIPSKVRQILSVMETYTVHTGVYVAFKTKRELKYQNELFLKYKSSCFHY